MKILRKLREWNREKRREIRSIPNTENETEVRKNLRKRAEKMGITLLPEPEGVDGGGHLRKGWRIEDIPKRNYEKHRYDRIPKELIGKPIISIVADDKKGKPYLLAHELGHASGKSLRKSSGDSGTDSPLRIKAEELRANLRGYKILKEEGADKETLRNARKGYYNQTINVLLSSNKKVR